MKQMKIWVTVITAMFMVIFTTSCKKDKYVELVGVCPVVISTNPVHRAINVPINQKITATFNEKMNPGTINSSSFMILNGITQISGALSYNETNATITFIPSAYLLPSTTYTGKVLRTVKDLMGNALQADYVWTFSTTAPDNTAPTVISTSPVNTETNVALNKVIRATFSEAMKPSTISNSTFIVQLGASVVTGSVTYNGSTAYFTPSSNLMPSSTYNATITTGATDLAGNALVINYVWTFDTGITSSTGGPNVDLQSADQFGILAGVGVSNNAGLSEIHDMNVGISPGVRSSVTGFPPAIVVNGAIFASDDSAPAGVAAMLTQAKQDLTDAYLFAEGATSPAPATVAGDQGGKTLAPGIYKSTSTLLIQSGDLTLDAGGNPNAVWIFQIASDFTTVGGAGGNVILSGGAQAKNVFWQTGSSATIGGGTSFKGNVLALTSITMNSGATAVGRMLARNGSVVLTSTNIINKP
jgi:hypothetical protein